MNNFSKYEDNLNLIGPILKDKRIEKGLSLEKFSSKLLLLGVNIPVTSLYRIENNQRTVRDYEICAISVVLGVDVNELLDLSELGRHQLVKLGISHTRCYICMSHHTSTYYTHFAKRFKVS